MSRRQCLSILCALVLAASSSLFAVQATPPPNVSGTWTGFLTNPDDPNDRDEAHVVLKQTGAELTGTGGPNANQQFAIQKGKIATTAEGTTVSFEVGTDNMVLQFDMKLVDGRLKGTVKAERGGEKRAGTVELERAK